MYRNCSIVIICCFYSALTLGQGKIGASANPTGNPIGGGDGYTSNLLDNNSNSRSFTFGDFNVSTTSQLLQALNNADPGEIVYILPGSTINLSSNHFVEIPPGVILAGNRGVNNAPGPLVITNNLTSEYLFSMKDNSRIFGYS